MKKLLTGFILSLFLIQNVFAAIPYTFTNGVVADATEVNSNFNYFEGKFSATSGHAHTGSDSKTLTTLGTITTGVWQGTVIDEVYGGTGLSSYASGDLIYATSDTGLARLAKGPIGSLLIFGNSSEPEWLSPGTSGQRLNTQGSGIAPNWVTNSFVIGSFTRNMTASSGNVSYVGLGFKPSLVIFSGGIDDTSAFILFGAITTPSQFEVDDSHIATANTYNTNASYCMQIQNPAGAAQLAAFATFDSDGFTLTWTKSGSPTGTATINYIAF